MKFTDFVEQSKMEEKKQEQLPPRTGGLCPSYAEWPDGHREYCSGLFKHEGAHWVEFAGPGAWWFGDVYLVGRR